MVKEVDFFNDSLMSQQPHRYSYVISLHNLLLSLNLTSSPVLYVILLDCWVCWLYLFLLFKYTLVATIYSVF